MTAEAVSPAIVASRDAWRSLVWFAPLTALWMLLIYRWPAIPASGVPTTTHQLAAHGLIMLGLWLGLEHTSLTPGQRRATWLAIMIPDTLWFAVAWSAAINGVFHPGTGPGEVIMPMVIATATSARPKMFQRDAALRPAAVPVATAIAAGNANSPVSTSPMPAGNANTPGSAPRSQAARAQLPNTRWS